ncbi:Alcohol dehydrogenase, zinc-binding domain protein, partial [mine drainage metagenome]
CAQPGDWVLVHGGSGGVGVAAVQVARARGMRTVATAGTPEGLALLHEIGADAAIGHADVEQALAATGGRGFDIVLEMAAHLGLSQALGLLAPGGRVALIGSRGPTQVNPRDLMSREASVQGILLFLATEEDLRRIHEEIGAGLRDGTLRPVARRIFALSLAPDAHRAVLAPGALGKITLEIP